MNSKAAVAYIGIGSNLGNSVEQVTKAIDAMNELDNVDVTNRSALYSSDPIGYSDQPNFVNAVCKISTSLQPLDILQKLQQIEVAFGRVRTKLLNRPRTLDLDLLLYENEQISISGLEVPHPRMHLRRFVLEPLVEIDDHVKIPGKGKASNWLNECQDQQVRILNHNY